MKGCTVVQGHARFTGPHEIDIDGEIFTAPRIFINAGGRANVPDMPGIDQVDYLTNTSILELDTLPKHLVVIGGSYIGLEFGQMYRRFGAEVTIVEKGPRLIAREDPDVSDAMKEILEGEGYQLPPKCGMHFLQATRRGNRSRPGLQLRRSQHCWFTCASCDRQAAQHR